MPSRKHRNTKRQKTLRIKPPVNHSVNSCQWIQRRWQVDWQEFLIINRVKSTIFLYPVNLSILSIKKCLYVNDIKKYFPCIAYHHIQRNISERERKNFFRLYILYKKRWQRWQVDRIKQWRHLIHFVIDRIVDRDSKETLTGWQAIDRTTKRKAVKTLKLSTVQELKERIEMKAAQIEALRGALESVSIPTLDGLPKEKSPKKFQR